MFACFSILNLLQISALFLIELEVYGRMQCLPAPAPNSNALKACTDFLAQPFLPSVYASGAHLFLCPSLSRDRICTYENTSGVAVS